MQHTCTIVCALSLSLTHTSASGVCGWRGIAPTIVVVCGRHGGAAHSGDHTTRVGSAMRRAHAPHDPMLGRTSVANNRARTTHVLPAFLMHCKAASSNLVMNAMDSFAFLHWTFLRPQIQAQLVKLEFYLEGGIVRRRVESLEDETKHFPTIVSLDILDMLE